MGMGMHEIAMPMRVGMHVCVDVRVLMLMLVVVVLRRMSGVVVLMVV
jgi:hypothetical protein